MRRLWMVGLILAHLVLVAAALADEASVYSTIDEHALQAPAEAESSLEDLARYLAGPARSDEERARAIYRWITANVEYDVEGSMAGARRGRTPEEVLEERRGVCSEYSALFQRLSELSGLEAVVIRGYGKGYGYSVSSKIPKSSNHAWNAVKIDGEWQLVDSTWGAGYLDPEEGFVERFEEFYFLTPPEDLVWTHLPEDPNWQLLDAPLSKEEFEGLVYAKPPFFKNEMNIVGPEAGTIDGDEGANVTLSAPEDVLLLARLLDEDGRQLPEDQTFAQKEDDGYAVRAAFPKAGNYTLRIYVKRAGEAGGEYASAIEYAVLAEAGIEGMTYPRTTGSFSEAGASLHRPLEGRLKAGSAQDFEILIPGAEEVAVISGGEWTHLSRDGDVFWGDVVLSEGEAQVAARFSGVRSYRGLLTYAVL